MNINMYVFEINYEEFQKTNIIIQIIDRSKKDCNQPQKQLAFINL